MFFSRVFSRFSPIKTPLNTTSSYRSLNVDFVRHFSSVLTVSNDNFITQTQNTTQIRFKSKLSERALRRKHLREKKKSKSNEKIPFLKETLRKLYLRTHPDLFGQYPEQKETNEKSYQELLGFLDAIEKTKEFPAAKNLVLPFYLKTQMEGTFQKVELNLRTTGGACNTLVEESLGKFFQQCGLPQVFQWQEGSWGKAIGRQLVENENLKYDKEEEPVVKQQEEQVVVAPAYQGSERKAPEENRMEKMMNELNDVFEIIAAVPLLDEKEYGEVKRYYEQEQGLDEIEKRGFRIKEGVEKIWKGEREIHVLIQGLDTDSAMIVQRILMHTIRIEKEIERLILEEEKEEQSKSTVNE